MKTKKGPRRTGIVTHKPIAELAGWDKPEANYDQTAHTLASSNCQVKDMIFAGEIGEVFDTTRECDAKEVGKTTKDKE